MNIPFKQPSIFGSTIFLAIEKDPRLKLKTKIVARLALSPKKQRAQLST